MPGAARDLAAVSADRVLAETLSGGGSGTASPSGSPRFLLTPVASSRKG